MTRLFPGFWGRESPRIIAVAREWFTMPHRRDMLAGLGGGIIQTMMGDEENYPFLDGLRAQWARDLNAEGEPETLRLLIERFNPANYTFEVRDGRRVPVDFQWPEAIARKNAEDLQRIGRDQDVYQLAASNAANVSTPVRRCRRTQLAVALAVPPGHRRQSARSRGPRWRGADPYRGYFVRRDRAPRHSPSRLA